jgi:hypothetical protein
MRKPSKEFQELLGSDREVWCWKHFETQFYKDMATYQIHDLLVCAKQIRFVPLVCHHCYVLSTPVDWHGNVILICIREVDVSNLRRESDLS